MVNTVRPKDKTSVNTTTTGDRLLLDGAGGIRSITVENFRSQSDALRASGNIQIITAGSAVDVATNANIVIVNKTVGGAITLTIPLAANKAGAVKIVDWKGDSDTNPITVVSVGSEKFNGLSQWTISGPYASAVFDPYSGAGYAV